MKDTLGILIAAIFAILLIVILPLVSILDNQDNMAYNTVLTQVTNYIDSVRTSGYIEKDEYNAFLEKLARTGNLYDIDIEVHKPILIPKTEGTETVYEEDTIIYNMIDIEKSISMYGYYKLDVGDQIYISIANTNIPSSSVIYRFVAGISKYEVVDISYGGIVTKIESKEYDKNTDIQDYIPQIVLGLPRNMDNDIDITTIKNIMEVEKRDENGQIIGIEQQVDYSYQYIFDITEENNKEIDIAVVLKNFSSFASGDDFLTVDTLKEYITLNGFYCGAAGDEYVIKDDNDGGAIKDGIDKLTENAGEYRFSIKLHDIRMESTQGNVSLSIAPRLGSNTKDEMTYYSSGRDTVTFYLINDYNKYACEIVGPYNEAGDPIPKSLGDVKAFIGQDIYFNINYKSIVFDGINSLLELIQGNLQVIENDIETDLYLNDDTRLDTYDVTEAEINEELNYGTIKVKLNYNSSPKDVNGSIVETKLYLKEKWINFSMNNVIAYNRGTAIEADKVISKYPLNSLERENIGYYIKPDDEAPKGKEALKDKLTVSIKRDELWQNALVSNLSGTPKYLVDSSAIRLDTENIIDEDGYGDTGSGLSKALLKNDAITTEYQEKALEGTTEKKYFSWEVKQSLADSNVTTNVYYKLKDRANNVSSEDRLDVYYELKAPKVGIVATDTDTLGTETKEYASGKDIWYKDPIYVHLRLIEDYEFPYTLTISSQNMRDMNRTRPNVTGGIDPRTSSVKSIVDYLGDDKQGKIFLEEGKWLFSGQCLTTLNHTSTSENTYFNIDRTPPSIAVPNYETYPEEAYKDNSNNEWVKSVNHFFVINDYLSIKDRNGNTTEPGSGIDKVTYYITADDGVKQEGTETEITDIRGLTGGYKLSGQTYKDMAIVVTATDNAGNSTEFTTKQYDYDNTAPVINAERDINDKNRIKVTITDADSGVVKTKQGETIPDYIYFRFTNDGSSDPALIEQEEIEEIENFNSGEYIRWDKNGNGLYSLGYSIQNQQTSTDGKSFYFEIVTTDSNEFTDFMWIYVPDNVDNSQINKCSVFEQPKIIVTQTYGGRYKQTFSGLDANLDQAVINNSNRLDYGHILNLDFTIENAAINVTNPMSAPTDTSNRYTKVQYAFVKNNTYSNFQSIPETAWTMLSPSASSYNATNRTITTGIYDKTITSGITSYDLWIRVNTRKEENGKIYYVHRKFDITMRNEMRIIGGAINKINSGNLVYFNATQLGKFMYEGAATSSNRPHITKLIVSIPNGSNGTSKTTYGYNWGCVDRDLLGRCKKEDYKDKYSAFTSNNKQYILLKKQTWSSDREFIGVSSITKQANRKDLYLITLTDDVWFSGSSSNVFNADNVDNWGAILVVPTSTNPEHKPLQGTWTGTPNVRFNISLIHQ